MLSKPQFLFQPQAIDVAPSSSYMLSLDQSIAWIRPQPNLSIKNPKQALHVTPTLRQREPQSDNPSPGDRPSLTLSNIV